jgi:MFS family permease
MGKIKQYKENIKLRLSALFPALTHKNFRYFWFGQCISLIGTWMQNAGQSWLVLQITDSAFLLGILNAAQFLPSLLFSLFAGVIVDRFPKRKITIITQAVLMLCAFMLTALIWTDHAKYIYIIIIALILGIAQSIDMPARQSMMVELVGKEDLMNAIALNSTIFNAARIIGPAVAGIVMATIGAGAAFFINGISFIAVIYGLLKIDAADKPVNKSPGKSLTSDALEGLKYIFKTPILYFTLLLAMILCVFSQNFNTMIPALAKNVLQQKEMGYGFLMSAMGIGAVVAALSLAIKGKGKPKYWVFLLGGGIMSVFVLLIGFQYNYILSSVLLAVAGWGMITFNASANSIVQVNSPDMMRGRIMSAYAFVTGGMTPIGSLYAGYTAQKLGTSFAFRLSGMVGIGAVIMITILYFKKEYSHK